MATRSRFAYSESCSGRVGSNPGSGCLRRTPYCVAPMRIPRRRGRRVWFPGLVRRSICRQLACGWATPGCVMNTIDDCAEYSAAGGAWRLREQGVLVLTWTVWYCAAGLGTPYEDQHPGAFYTPTAAPSLARRRLVLVFGERVWAIVVGGRLADCHRSHVGVCSSGACGQQSSIGALVGNLLPGCVG